jgi:DNA-binding NtrC family response regulator
MVDHVAPTFRCGEMLSNNPRMGVVFDQATVLAGVDHPVLIEGESGAGKAELARAIHRASATRRHGPLVEVSCAALPENLIECELFGHVKNTFVGTSHTRVGALEQAQGGTLLLRAVEELPLATQARLASAIETRHFARVGSREEIRADVRVIATTLVRLKVEADSGAFLPALLRLFAPRSLRLPPLRHRPEDISLLATQFIQQFTNPNSRAPELTREANDVLLRHSWWGNVRELETVIQDACIMAHGEPIQVQHLPLADIPSEKT